MPDQKTRINIKFLKENAEIPRELLKGFVKDTPGADWNYVKQYASPKMDGRTGRIKVGVFDSSKMVGFATANFYQNATSIYAIYLSPKYRRWTTANSMYKLIRDATEERGGREVWWVKMSPISEKLFRLARERSRKRRTSDRYKFIEGEPGMTPEGLVELNKGALAVKKGNVIKRIKIMPR